MAARQYMSPNMRRTRNVGTGLAISRQPLPSASFSHLLLFWRRVSASEPAPSMTGDGGYHSFSPPFLSLRRSTFDGGLGKHLSSAGSKRWGEQLHPRSKKALEETGVSFFSLCSAPQPDRPLYGTLDNSMRYSFYKRFEEFTK